MIKLNLLFTTSKFLAYIILLIGTIYSFLYHDSNVLIATFSAASAVIALKTYTSSQIRKKELENSKPPEEIG